MKKFSFLLCLLLVVSLVFAGCADSGTGSSQEEVAGDGESNVSVGQEDEDDLEAPVEVEPSSGFLDSIDTLIMGTEAGFRPYEYYDDNNEVVGVDVDIAREIAAALGKELLVEDMPFDSIIPNVNSGKAHFGAAGISVTPERADQVDFTIEYATSKQVILTMEDSDIMEEADLDGKIVGVQLGTVADLVLTDDYPEVEVRQYNKYFEAANDLMTGRLDAIVLDILPGEELVKTGEGMVIREKELFTDVYAFCVQKGNTELLDAMNEVMQRLVDEGKIVEFTTNHSAD